MNYQLIDEKELMNTVNMYRNGAYIDWNSVANIMGKPAATCQQIYELGANGHHSQQAVAFHTPQKQFNFQLASSQEDVQAALDYLDAMVPRFPQQQPQAIPILISLDLAKPDNNTYANLDRFDK